MTFVEHLKGISGAPFGGVANSVISIATIAVAFGVGYFGMSWVPPGRYPKLVLYIPGFVAGAVVFLAGAVLTYRNRRAE